MPSNPVAVVAPCLVALSMWTASAQSTQPPAPPAAAVGSMLRGDAQHGRYLAEHVAMCVECHSERDQTGTIIPSARYLGGVIPLRSLWAMDWADRAPRNAGLPGYTDAQAMRLLTEGAIARDGRQLRPPMPRFRMTPQDAADVIAFMRSVP